MREQTRCPMSAKVERRVESDAARAHCVTVRALCMHVCIGGLPECCARNGHGVPPEAESPVSQRAVHPSPERCFMSTA